MAEARSERGNKIERPLSPHLMIHTPHINMVMSILHRMTGAALYFGMVLLAWWLTAAATGPEYFAFVQSVFATWPMQLVLFGYTWALIHHMVGGVRHFIWDTGAGFDIRTIDLLSWGSIVVSAIAALAIWAYVLNGGGVAL